MHARTHACRHARTHACTHTRSHARTHACTHVHTCTHTHNLCYFLRMSKSKSIPASFTVWAWINSASDHWKRSTLILLQANFHWPTVSDASTQSDLLMSLRSGRLVHWEVAFTFRNVRQSRINTSGPTLNAVSSWLAPPIPLEWSHWEYCLSLCLNTRYSSIELESEACSEYLF